MFALASGPRLTMFVMAVTQRGSTERRSISEVRPFRVRISEVLAYWTIVDWRFQPVAEADQFLRESRFGRDRAERTTQIYAGDLCLYFNWLTRKGLNLESGPSELGRFLLELRVQPIESGRSRGRPRSAERINTILSVVRSFYKFAVAHDLVGGEVLSKLFEVGDDRWLPAELKPDGNGLRYRAAPRHILRGTRDKTPRVATPEEFHALIEASEHWRDRFLLALLWFGGLRVGQALGLRREDLHFASDSTMLGCPTEGPHIHIRKRDNVNRADSKRRRDFGIPAHHYILGFYEHYLEERAAVKKAEASDFVFVNLFAAPLGEPMKPHGANRIFTTLSCRAGIDPPITPHSFRHAAGTRWTENGGIDVAQALLGHSSIQSTQIYNHVRGERLRDAVDAVTPGSQPSKEVR